MCEHPMVSHINKTGYPNQPKHVGIDAMGDEILEGDSIIEDPNTGEIILEDNLEDYLIEILGFKYKTAE